jgi:hypothetical protein
MVFLGAEASGRIGRSLTGEVDLDGDGIADVVFGGEGQVWVIPGEGPKIVSGSTHTGGGGSGTVTPMFRNFSGLDAIDDFRAVRYTTEDAAGGVMVGPAGDVDGDGRDDLVVGRASEDPHGRENAGRVWLVYGTPAPVGAEIPLDRIGSDLPGLVIDGVAKDGGLGTAVGGGGDVNGDGVDDAVAGAPGVPPDPGGAYVFSPLLPDPVDSLVVERRPWGLELEWNAPDRAVTYNVHLGTITRLRMAGRVRTSDMAPDLCAIDGSSDGDARPDAAAHGTPAVGETIIYLVTAENWFGESVLGPSSGAPARIHDRRCP